MRIDIDIDPHPGDVAAVAAQNKFPGTTVVALPLVFYAFV